MKNLLLIPILLVLFTGCNSSTGPEGPGSITGSIKEYYSGNPVKDFKIYLVDNSFTPDTLNYENHSAIIDSAFTDDEGNYQFPDIETGKYSLAPYTPDIDRLSKISWDNESDETSFEMNGNDYTVNFIYDDMDFGDSGPNTFQINIKIINYPARLSHFTPSRRSWLGPIPILDTIMGHFTENGNVYVGNLTYGFTALFISMDNYFSFTQSYLHLSNGSHSYTHGEFVIYFPLGSTPARSWFVYDESKKEIKQVTEDVFNKS